MEEPGQNEEHQEGGKSVDTQGRLWGNALRQRQPESESWKQPERGLFPVKEMLSVPRNVLEVPPHGFPDIFPGV